MIAFLKTGELKPPRAVVAAPDKGAVGVAFLTASFEEGTLFLKSAAGQHYRLEWPKHPRAPSADPTRKTGLDHRRALPPGEYTLTCYRIGRRDAKAVEWIVSATGSNLRRLVVRTGEEQRVRIDDTIRLTGRAEPGNGGVKIQVKIAGEQGSGLRIYRDGKPIEIGYRLVDARKRELARGTLHYS